MTLDTRIPPPQPPAMPVFQSDLLRIRDAVMRNEGDQQQLEDAARFLDHECGRFSDMVRIPSMSCRWTA